MGGYITSRHPLWWLLGGELARRLVGRLRHGPTARRGQWRAVDVAARAGVSAEAIILAVPYGGGRLQLRVHAGRREIAAA